MEITFFDDSVFFKWGNNYRNMPLGFGMNYGINDCMLHFYLGTDIILELSTTLSETKVDGVQITVSNFRDLLSKLK